jgi:undecaprenyl-diphosphatase
MGGSVTAPPRVPQGSAWSVRPRAAMTDLRQAPLGRALLGVLRWIGGYVRGFHAAVGTFLLLGFAAVAGGTAGFALLAREVTRGRTTGWDEAALHWMQSLHSPALDGWALEVTALGGKVVVWMVVLLSSVFLWASRHHYSAVLLWVAGITAGLVSAALKLGFDRPRPDVFEWRTPYAGLSSFPSGHSTAAVVVYGTLAFLIARLAPTRALRWLVWGVAAAVIVLIGLSRVYLGVHYPSDVLGGFVAGSAWAVACGMGIEAVRYFRGRRPEVEAEEEDLGGGPTETSEQADGRPA